MPPSRISSNEGVAGEWRAVGVKQMVVVAEKATRGGECLMGGGGRKCDGGVVGVKQRVWWPKKRWVWWVKRGVKRRVVVAKKSPSVSHFERGRGGVCREEDVGGQQNPSVSHSSAGGVVRVERW